MDDRTIAQGVNGLYKAMAFYIFLKHLLLSVFTGSWSKIRELNSLNRKRYAAILFVVSDSCDTTFSCVPSMAVENRITLECSRKGKG